jgi:hypothetical protein
MGKQIHLAFTTVFLFFGTIGMAIAAHSDNGPGCGLGKLAWGDYPNQQDVGPQVLMSTTNLTFGSQSFGISSGTSGCTHDGVLVQEEKVNVFATANFDNISQDMAQGQGEHLTALAMLMDIPIDQHPVLFIKAQERYAQLLQSSEISPNALIEVFHEIITASPPIRLTAQTQ